MKGHRGGLLALLAAVLVAAVGCSPNVDEARWSEEVLLHDGTLIVIERQAKRKPSGFPDTRRGALLHESLRYAPLGVEWKIDDHTRSAFSFELFDGVPHLVIYMRVREWCREKDPKQFTAEFYRWEGGRWVEMQQDQFPTRRALKNLYRAYWGQTREADAKGLVSWGEKAREDGFFSEKPDTVHDWFTRGSRNCAQYQMNLPK
jgi:hypothetical protein